MDKMNNEIRFNLPIWVAKCCGNEKNCVYPDARVATTAEELKEFVKKDHTFISFKDNYRSGKNFKYTDVVTQDCDNTHSDNPSEWITMERIAKDFSDVQLIIYTSRHHMKPKDGRSARPRFHVLFFADRITDPEEYRKLMQRVQDYFPYFDSAAQDAARFFYGNPDARVYVQPGIINLTMFFDLDEFTNLGTQIVEGSRNSTLFKMAVRSMKRYGDSSESRSWFDKESERCVPPLDAEELDAIWRSASKYYASMQKDPAYITPEAYNASGPVKWEDPIPFGKYAVEPFPVDALPDEIADYVTAVAESTQTPVDMAGTIALSIMSVCLQGKYSIQGKADWTEPLNTYALVVAEPSERKSAVLKMMMGPVNVYEAEYNKTHAGSVMASKMRLRSLINRRKKVEDLMSQGKAKPEEVEAISREIADFQEEHPMKLCVDDITTEKLVSVLSENHGRASLVSSEGGIFDTLSGIYTKNVNIDVMLKSYSGDPIRVDRIGRESETVLNPTLTVLLMVQPNVVSSVLGNKTFRGRGLTARFLYCIPKSRVGTRSIESKPVPEDIRRRYEQKLYNLLEDEYPNTPEAITLSPEAQQLFYNFAIELEPKINSEYADMADWVGKLVGNTLRLAGLLCRAEIYRGHDFLEEPEKLVVSGKTMERAIILGRYFLNHAESAYDVLPIVTTYDEASSLMKTLIDKGLTEFDRRTAMRVCRQFKKAADVQPVLDFLEDYGYIKMNEVKKHRAGRPKLPGYTINPLSIGLLCRNRP